MPCSVCVCVLVNWGVCVSDLFVCTCFTISLFVCDSQPVYVYDVCDNVLRHVGAYIFVFQCVLCICFTICRMILCDLGLLVS